MVRDVAIDKDVQDILKADDTLNRIYVNPANRVEADLFIAFFKTQRTGQSPHSPKNCLPGSGWEPTKTGLVSIPVPGLAEPILANRYVVSHGDEKAVVIYWYQSHQRIIASEYAAKFWLVADSIRYHRSDTALVKLVLPIPNNDADAATAIGINLVQAVFPDLQKQLPR
jgi:EpsI family protein